jgi:signal transduction histidine kinase
MSDRRPGLWAEVALTLALTTLVAVTLNGGLLWLVSGQARLEARIQLAQELAQVLGASIEMRADTESMEQAARAVLVAFDLQQQSLDALYVVDRDVQVLASKVGEPPSIADDGLRAALYAREAHVDVTQRLAADGPLVVATSPIPSRGPPKAAIRVALRATSSSSIGDRVGFLVGYGLFTALIIGGVGYVLFRQRVVRPIQQIQAGTARIAQGAFEHRLRREGPRELVMLTDALNEMAEGLTDYRTRTREQVESLEAAKQALEQAQEDLVRSAQLASVGRIAAGIAHEVGNPLSAVMGYLDLLAEEDELGEAQQDLLVRTSKEVARIHRILRELLDYSRPGSSQLDRVDLRAVVEGALGLVQHQSLFKQLTVTVVVPVETPEVFAEREKLHQVFVNLFLNAADAMRGVGELSVSTRTQDRGVWIDVRDTGPGLPDEPHDRLFEPFYSTKGAGEGTGLGLAISLAIIDGFGGKLHASNRATGGAEFSIWLPLAESEGSKPLTAPA